MHDEAAGVLPAPLPLAVLAEASSLAVVGPLPHVELRLALVGTPGSTPAVEQVEALVGSCADPTPATKPPNAAVAVA
jgi:hypothetical protein